MGMDKSIHALSDRTLLQQIIAELPEGVIVVNSDQTIAWANNAALAMHGVKSLKDLGETVSAYCGGSGFLDSRIS
jgi:PAS domain-containing protein